MKCVAEGNCVLFVTDFILSDTEGSFAESSHFADGGLNDKKLYCYPVRPYYIGLQKD